MMGFTYLKTLDEKYARLGGTVHFYTEGNEWKNIENIYKRIIQNHPNDMGYRTRHAYAARQANKWEVAVQEFETIGDHFYEGGYFVSLERFNQARAITYSAYGWQFLENNQLDKGIPWLEKSDFYYPYYAWAATKLAASYQRKNEPQLAKKWGEKALLNAIDPQDINQSQQAINWANTQLSQ